MSTNIIFNAKNKIKILTHSEYIFDEISKKHKNTLFEMGNDNELIEVEPNICTTKSDGLVLDFERIYGDGAKKTLVITDKIKKITPLFIRNLGDKIKNIQVDKNNPFFTVSDKCLYSKDYTKLYYCFNKGSQKAFKFREEVKSIEPYAFAMCKFSEYIFNDNLVEINRYAFENCTISKIILPDSLKTLGDGAFKSCLNLESIYIPCVEEIGNSIFWDCPKLSEIKFNDKIRILDTHLGSRLFSLKKIRLPKFLLGLKRPLTSEFDLEIKICKDVCFIPNADMNPIYDVSDDNPYYYSIDGSLFDKRTDELLAIPSVINGKYIVPNKCKSIGRFTFIHCDNLKQLILPDNGYFNDLVNIKTNLVYSTNISDISLVNSRETLLDKVLNMNMNLFTTQQNKWAISFLENTGFIDIKITKDEIVGLFIDKKISSSVLNVKLTLNSDNLLSFVCSCKRESNDICKHTLALILKIKNDYGINPDDVNYLINNSSLRILTKKVDNRASYAVISKAIELSEDSNNIRNIIKTNNEINAEVKGRDGYYFVKLYPEANTLRYTCNCAYNKEKKGACKHILALILHLNNNSN